MIPKMLQGLNGEWVGDYKLWLTPTKPAIESESSAVAGEEGEGRFFAFRYFWGYEGRARHGFILLGDDPLAERCEASWVDSFHNSHRIMPCRGAMAGSGAVSVTGHYPAPPDPDWGWRTAFERPTPDQLVMRMWNVTPDGTEELAVEATYRRR